MKPIAKSRLYLVSSGNEWKIGSNHLFKNVQSVEIVGHINCVASIIHRKGIYIGSKLGEFEWWIRLASSMWCQWIRSFIYIELYAYSIFPLHFYCIQLKLYNGLFFIIHRIKISMYYVYMYCSVFVSQSVTWLCMYFLLFSLNRIKLYQVAARANIVKASSKFW